MKNLRSGRSLSAPIGLLVLSLATLANAAGFDEAAFDLWVDARAGAGDPVYWYSTGTVRAYPSGELLFLMEGYDTVRTVEGGAMAHRMVGDTHVFSAPVFLDFPIPGTESRYQAWENYDFFIQPEAGVAEPHQLSWARVGPLPPWAGGGQSVMHLVTWRVESFDDVPAGLRRYIEEEAPLWKAPPRDLPEIRELQAAP